jgi:hypothetical protein
MPLRLEISAEPASGVGLSRRRSLLKRPSLQKSTDTTSSGALLCLLTPRARVPTEILERIIDCYVLDARLPVCYGIPETANFFATFTSCIEPYITVSKSFRYLLLRSFFRVLVFGKEDAASMLLSLSNFNKEYCSENGGFFWVKFVACSRNRVARLFFRHKMLNICAYIQITYFFLVPITSKRQNSSISHPAPDDANRLQ